MKTPTACVAGVELEHLCFLHKGLWFNHHVMIDKLLSMVSGCALETDVCRWMFKTKVSMVQGQEDAPLKGHLVDLETY